VKQQLENYFTYKLWPPISPRLLAPAMEAIEAVRAGDIDRPICWSTAAGTVRTTGAKQLVDELQLADFVVVKDQHENAVV
jgi:hypothetical protein